MNLVEVKRRQIEICSLVIGLVTLLVLGNIVGDNGVAYIAVAMECFLFFWNLTGRALAEVLGRILRGRSIKGQFRNVAKMHSSALVLESVIGLVGSALMFLLAGQIARHVFRAPHSAPLIMILAPVIFLRTLSSVVLAYFQGEGTELPTVIASVLRQVGILLLGILFGKLFQGYGNKVSTLLKQENFRAMYGGMGIALAVSVTEAIVLLFLFLLYRGSRGNNMRVGSNEGMRVADSFGGQVRVLYNNMFPVMLADVLQILPLILGIVFYRKVNSSDEALMRYGVFYGKYLALCGIVVLPIYALLLGSCAKAAASQRKDELRLARNHFWGGLHVGTVHALFCVMVFLTLAPQLAEVFGKTSQQLTEEMLRKGAVLILPMVLGRYCLELLRQMRGKYLSLGILAVLDILYTISIAVMLNAGSQGIMALIYAGILIEVVLTAAAGVLVCYQIRCGIDWLQGLVIPVIAVCMAGLFLMLLEKWLAPNLGASAAVLIGVAASAVVYWGILIFARNFRGQDMGYIPGGSLIQKIAQLLRL